MILTLGFIRSITEFTLYIKGVKGHILVVSLSIDDLLIIESCKEQIDEFKEEKSVFEMTDLGGMTFFLGM